MLTVGSLFAGIGGLELGLENTGGFRTIWQVEIDPYAVAVLKKHWPEVPKYGDITRIDWSQVQRPDVLCGGFPCQDISQAGKGAGLAGARSGLWKEYVRAIRALEPAYVIVENVPALRSRGLGTVLADLASCGYDAEWDCISASAVGAPHVRDRIFIVGYKRADANRSRRDTQRASVPQVRVGIGLHAGGQLEQLDSPLADAEREHVRRKPGGILGTTREVKGQRNQRQRGGDSAGNSGQDDRARTLADPGSAGLEGQGHGASGAGAQEPVFASSRAIGRSAAWSSEPDVGRVANGVPSRVDRLKCLGNAVVPQVAEEVGRRILIREGLL